MGNRTDEYNKHEKRSWTLQAQIELLDAAIDDYLRNHPTERYERTVQTPASIGYALLNGHPSTITLRKKTDSLCLLIVNAPMSDDIDTMTPEQLADRPMRDLAHELIVYSDTERKRNIALYHDAKDQRKARMAEYEKTIAGLLMALNQDGLWGETQPEETSADNEPQAGVWERIPDHKWDRLAVKLLYESHTSPEIANKIGDITAKTVNNRLSVLRSQYDFIETREEIERKMRNKRQS